MGNATVFESWLKEKFNTYLDLRESQGHNASKEQHIFVSLDKYLQNTGFNGKNLPPYIIDGWLTTLPDKLNVNTINVYISHYAVLWVYRFCTREINQQQELYPIYLSRR